MKILVVGTGAREQAIVQALHRAQKKSIIFSCGTSHHPGIQALTQAQWVGNILDVKAILAQAKEWNIDLAIIGPEAPLEKGIADCFWANGIKTIGPKRSLARIETSKQFTRDLMRQQGIAGLPRYRSFAPQSSSLIADVMAYLAELGEGHYVIKADGLMGGKGVKVAGDHLHSIAEAVDYCLDLAKHNHAFVIEEKLIGQEFSWMAFCDGVNIFPMPIVQDHKRAFVGDQGPNTGGMGSYSVADFSLPFLTQADLQTAWQINEAVFHALCQYEPYIGVLYGSFIATKDGVAVIEFNARFGDPEALNVLTLLESDFVELCEHWVNGTLTSDFIRFKKQASVCKYAVPEGYPNQAVKNVAIDVTAVLHPQQLYFAAVNQVEDQILLMGSRAVAYVGVADHIHEAEVMAEHAMQAIRGPVFHRADIGTDALIQQRIRQMQALRVKEQG